MDDQQIIKLYNERSEQAISKTSEKYGEYCFAIAYNILFNKQDSEECVNDTWLKIWNCIPPQKPNSFKIFIAKITRNIAFDKFRKMNRKKRGGNTITLALEEISEFLPSDTNVESQVYENELVKSVNRFLYSLSERDCNIFINRYFHVESIGIIANKYRLTESNVQKILSRTRMNLKKYLESEGYII